MTQRIFLLDGFNLLYRAYFAIRNLTDQEGNPTNAVYGLVVTLQKLIREQNPTHIGVVFDPKGPTIRHQAYADYKATRDPMPEALALQIDVAAQALEVLGVPLVVLEGYEADDVLATLAEQAKAKGLDAVVVTSDKDLYQLVDDHMSVLNPHKNNLMMGPVQVKEIFGVRPDQVVDVLSLMGDSADNIPGVPGIGEKGAKTLITQYETLDNLLDHAQEIKRKGYREGLINHRDKAIFSKELVIIDRKVPVELDLELFEVTPPDPEKVRPFFTAMRFHSLLKDLAEPEEEKVSVAFNFKEVTDQNQFINALAEESKKGTLFLAITPDPMEDGPKAGPPRAISFCADGENVLAHGFAPEDWSDLLEQVGKTVKKTNPQWVIHNSKFLARAMEELLGFSFLPAGDTMLSAYLLHPSRGHHRLREVSLDNLRTEPPGFPLQGSSAEDGQDSLGQKEAVLECCAGRVTFVSRLHGLLLKALEDAGLSKVYKDMELPLVQVLAHMEARGIRLDGKQLEDMGRFAGGELDRLEKEIHDLAGEPFNINSPKQLGLILFEKLGMPIVKKTKKTKSYSTSQDVLEQLALQFELPRLILEYRNLAKLKGTYLDALPVLIAEDGRIHCSFHQEVAATGRLSSSDPNLQNIPIRTELGRKVRDAFLAEPGCLLVAADYSQIELRVLAHMSSDPGLSEAFTDGEDIHRHTAATVFGIMPQLVDDEMRRRAKAVNFGILYGMGAFRLSNDLGISRAEAKAFIDTYFERFPAIQDFIHGAENQAEEDGFVATLLGRKRFFPEMKTAGGMQKQALKRQAVNAIIQGTAADLMKIGMIHVWQWLQKEIPEAKLVLQVHDELVLEVQKEKAEWVKENLVRLLTEVAELSVPLVLDAHVASNWGELK